VKLLTILSKELQEIVKNRLLLFSVALPPVIFAAVPIIMLFAAKGDPMNPDELEVLYRMEPALRGVDAVTATQLLLMTQMMIFFLMVPAMLPMVIASFSIIGEKQARSLEPLLATPIKVWELLVGKCLAAVLPAIAATWLGYGIAVLGVYVLGTELTVRAMLGPVWWVSMLTLAPLLSLAAVAIGIIVSSRVNDTRVAQQFSIVLVLPVLGLFVGQMAGRVLISMPVILLGSLGLLAVDVALLYVAVILFRRERILTEWR